MEPENASQPPVLSIEQTARAIGIGRATFYQLLAANKGPPTFRIGRRRLIRRAALEKWLAELESAEASHGHSAD